MISKEGKKQMVNEFKNSIQTNIIAKKYRVTSVRIRQIINSILSKEELLEIKNRKKEETANRYKEVYDYRYKNDKEFRDRMIKNALNRYYKLKDKENIKVGN